MYAIEIKQYGFHLTFGGIIPAMEMKKWLNESIELLKTSPISFGVFVDMRTLTPLDSDTQYFLEEGQKAYKANGMKRSVVILSKEEIRVQFKRIAWLTGIYQWERYINSADNLDWECKGVDWIVNNIDPDPVEDPTFIDKILEDIEE